MANTLDWMEIRTKDIVRAAKFFEDLFGWKVNRQLTAEGTEYWIFDTGGEARAENLRRGAFWLRPGADSGVVMYVLVEDIDATLQRVVALGGKVVSPKTSEGPRVYAYFADPDGTVWGLWEESA